MEENKKLIFNRMKMDGKLVSPIDLTLENSCQITLEPLEWRNFDDRPAKMKLTNTGETVIVSAKWGQTRPYLTGGPLAGNYVFSQIHFHWGQHENEGSEHTIKGVSCPMEMHVVLFKTCYLTQEAALKHEDGVVILVYLVKVGNKSCKGLRWLTLQLENIANPKSHMPLEPTPLSTLLVPVSKDYLIYWGALQTNHCSHTLMWLISRAALAITVEDLNHFRTLKNARSQQMTKNFRDAVGAQGRMIFHINPSANKDNLLLPGSIEPPGNPLVVNFSQVPSLNSDQARTIFNSGLGDFYDDECDKLSADSQVKRNTETPGNKIGDNVSLERKRDSPATSNSPKSEKTAKAVNKSPAAEHKSNMMRRKPSDRKKERNGNSAIPVSTSLQPSEGVKGESPKRNIPIKGGSPKPGSPKPTNAKPASPKPGSPKPSSPPNSTAGVEKKEDVNICISHYSLSSSVANKETPLLKTANRNNNTQSKLPVRKHGKKLESSLVQYFRDRPESRASENASPRRSSKPTSPAAKLGSKPSSARSRDNRKTPTTSIPKQLR